MKLYPKQLKSMASLEQERKNLHKQLRELEEAEFFSMENIASEVKSGFAQGAGLGFLSDIPVLSNPLVQSAIKWIKTRFSRNGATKSAHPISAAAPIPPKKNIIKSVAVEFISGYLKWKAIELSFKGIRHLIKVRRENKDRN